MEIGSLPATRPAGGTADWLYNKASVTSKRFYGLD
jgi:hypothetical protein